MAVDELTCMAPGKDAGHGRRRGAKAAPTLAQRLTLVETDGGARAYRASLCRVVDSWAQTDVYDIGKRSTTARYLCRTGPLPAMATVVCLITI